MGRFGAFIPSNGAATNFLPSMATYSSGLVSQVSTPLPGILNAQAANFTADTTAGFRLAEIECGWDQGEPTQGTFSASYLSNMAQLCLQYKNAGYRVAVSAGLHYPPAWVLGLANGQYLDQTSASSGTPNFAWNPAVRAAAAAYINQLVAAISSVVAVDYYRVGLSPSGECYLPNTSTHQWWAFDALAQGNGTGLPAGIWACPLPGWIPGASTWTPAGGSAQPVTVPMATSWWNWYMNAIINAHNWEFSAFRAAGWTGLIMYCMPGLGAVPNVITSRLNQLLAPMTGNTNDNQMEIGSAWHLQLAALNLANAVVNVSSVYDNSGSPANNASVSGDNATVLAAADPWISHWSSTRWLAYLAAQHGLYTLGENVGSNVAADVAGIMSQAQACGLYGLMWSYDAQMYDGTHATATQVVNGFTAAY
jgi:hypothetical protein